jgi:hypothetical protein
MAWNPDWTITKAVSVAGSDAHLLYSPVTLDMLHAVCFLREK